MDNDVVINYEYTRQLDFNDQQKLSGVDSLTIRQSDHIKRLKHKVIDHSQKKQQKKQRDPNIVPGNIQYSLNIHYSGRSVSIVAFEDEKNPDVDALIIELRKIVDEKVIDKIGMDYPFDRLVYNEFNGPAKERTTIELDTAHKIVYHKYVMDKDSVRIQFDEGNLSSTLTSSFQHLCKDLDLVDVKFGDASTSCTGCIVFSLDFVQKQDTLVFRGNMDDFPNELRAFIHFFSKIKDRNVIVSTKTIHIDNYEYLNKDVN